MYAQSLSHRIINLCLHKHFIMYNLLTINTYLIINLQLYLHNVQYIQLRMTIPYTLPFKLFRLLLNDRIIHSNQYSQGSLFIEIITSLFTTFRYSSLLFFSIYEPYCAITAKYTIAISYYTPLYINSYIHPAISKNII